MSIKTENRRQTALKIESPLAPASEVRLLKTFSAARLVKDWKSSLGIDISQELSGIETISLYRCEESQLDFFLPLSAAGSSRLYAGLQKFDWFYMPDKWEFDMAIRDLAGSRRILEVGCGQGFFISEALKRLKCDEVKGIEMNEQAVERALKEHLPVERADLKELARRGETFDAVCSFQVLEHVTEPRPFLESMLGVLAPGGTLIICVPNKDSFIKHQYNLLDMPPHHMTRWNLATFRYLEKLFALKMVRADIEPLAKYHVRGYVSAYFQLLRRKVPIPGLFLPELAFSAFLERTGLYRRLRGQSIYAAFKKM